jgi:hypothetical protein
MRGDEVKDSGALLGTALDEVTVMVRDVHKAVAARVFGALGDAGQSVRLMHDGISAIAYTSTRLGLRVLPPAVGAAAGAIRDPAAASAHDSPAGRFALGALNGFWGDRLAVTRRTIAPVMRMRTHEGRMRRIPSNVAFDAGERATGRIVLFLHGLCENDLSWWLGAQKNWGDPSVTFGSKLREDDGWTPIYVVFNSGLHISDNGRRLADRIGELVAAWPMPVTEVALIGHSMGGLIARSSAHQAYETRDDWVAQLRHVIGLGAPHLGAPLERFVARGTHRMSRLPETRPFATWLNRRSVGIKDLRYGAVLEADWAGWDPDTCLDDRCTDAALIPGVQYAVAAATLSKRPHGLLAHDLLVQHASAHGVGPTRRIAFEADRTFHIGGKHHFDLLGHPDVYARLRSWLAAPVPGQPSSGIVTDDAADALR